MRQHGADGDDQAHSNKLPNFNLLKSRERGRAYNDSGKAETALAKLEFTSSVLGSLEGGEDSALACVRDKRRDSGIFSDRGGETAAGGTQCCRIWHSE